MKPFHFFVPNLLVYDKEFAVEFVRGYLNYDVDAASEAVVVDCSVEPSKTQQQFAEDADINTIVRRFGLTGQLPETLYMPQSGDFVDAKSFEESMALLVKAREEFMTLPGDVRYRFANDPGRLIEFLDNPENRDEALKLGLIAKPPEVTRDAVIAIDELASRLVPSGSGDVPGAK